MDKKYIYFKNKHGEYLGVLGKQFAGRNLYSITILARRALNCPWEGVDMGEAYQGYLLDTTKEKEFIFYDEQEFLAKYLPYLL